MQVSSREIESLHTVPSDGGWGWLIVFGSFLTYVLIAGLILSFGVMYNDVTNAFPEAQNVDVATIPMMFVSVSLLLSVVSGALSVAFSCRKVTFVGGLLAGIGISLNFFAMNTFYMKFCFFIAGIGASLALIPSIIIVTKSFTKRRTQAVGMALAGTGVGTMIFPIPLQILVDEYGFRGALLIGGSLLFHICAAALLYREPKVNNSSRTTLQEVIATPDQTKEPNKYFKWIEKHLRIDLTLLYNGIFLLVFFSTMFLYFGYPQTTTFIPSYIESLGYSKFSSGILITVASFGDFLGRFLSGYLFRKTRFATMTGYITATICLTISSLGMAAPEYYTIAVCIFFYGYFAGTAVIFIPTLLTENHGASKLPSAFGICRTGQGISTLLGPSLAGYIKDETGSFAYALIGLGVVTSLSPLLMFCVVLIKRGICIKLTNNCLLRCCGFTCCKNCFTPTK